MSGNAYLGEMIPAAHSRRKSAMWVKLGELDTDPDFWPTLLMRLADGDFLAAIAAEIQVNHSILRNWIRGNKPREDAYQEADRAGRKARVEKVMAKVHATAMAEITEAPTRMEQLRAAEIMLKQNSEAESVTAPPKIGDINIVFVEANNGKPAEKVIDPVS